MIKITVTAENNRRYISLDLPGFGNNEQEYNLGKGISQVNNFSNFSGFNGTEEEWKTLLRSTKEVKIENIGV